MKTALSLKGRALQCVAQREHSRVELRRKLLMHAQAMSRLSSLATGDDSEPVDEARIEAEVDSVIDWMLSQGYLSDERFAESRVHARASRFGNLRIRGELSQHGVTLTPEATQALKHSEVARAREVWQRKFSSLPGTLSERSRQMRFLTGRGFSAEVISRVLRGLEQDPSYGPPGSRDDGSL